MRWISVSFLNESVTSSGILRLSETSEVLLSSMFEIVTELEIILSSGLYGDVSSTMFIGDMDTDISLDLIDPTYFLFALYSSSILKLTDLLGSTPSKIPSSPLEISHLSEM